MKLKVTILLLLVSSMGLFANERLTESEVARIADAIYLAEGGTKAKVPYGILSIKVRNKAHARQICVNTIRNNHARWLNAGKPGEFLHFLADRYCPASDSLVGNRNWKRNVTYFFEKSAPVTLAKR